MQGLGTLPGEALGLGLRKERTVWPSGAQLPRRLGWNLSRSWRTDKKASPKSEMYSGLCLKMFQEGKTKPRKLTALVKMDVKDGKGQVPSRKAM